MSPLQAVKEHCASCDKGPRNQYRRLSRMVSYPPPSTGTNYNLVDKVEHEPQEKGIWKVIYAPDGRFVYDSSIKMLRRPRRKRCPSCRNFLDLGERKCLECQAKTRKERNRRYYLLKKEFKTVSP
jgi:hypothetical protein